jgi:hypothetical protein
MQASTVVATQGWSVCTVLQAGVVQELVTLCGEAMQTEQQKYYCKLCCFMLCTHKLVAAVTTLHVMPLVQDVTLPGHCQ